MRNFEIMRYIVSILFIFAIVFASCKNNNNQTNTPEVSSDARVKNFTFQTDTANPGLTEAVYKIEHSSDIGVIYNIDSLRFQTQLDSVVPMVAFESTPGKVEYILPDTTIVATGSDTMNLSQRPILLHVTASDMKSEMWYEINLTVHQVDPELYVWKKLNDAIFAPQSCETKAFYKLGKIYLLVNNGLCTQVYVSPNGSEWQKIADQVATLPTPCSVRDIVMNNDTLYYIADNHLYRSADVLTWEAIDFTNASFKPVNMLMAYHQKAWCIIEVDGEMVIATVAGDSIKAVENIQDMPNGVLPASFPINDFAALEFVSSSERPRAMIVGGRSENGSVVNSRWNIEYAANTGYRIKNFSITQPSFASLTGASIIQYDEQLIMFGGIDNDLSMRSDMLYSDDEGMNWYVPDTAKNQLPASYKSRERQSIVVDDENNIYIIGGQSQTEIFSDVYSGFLNSINW